MSQAFMGSTRDLTLRSWRHDKRLCVAVCLGLACLEFASDAHAQWQEQFKLTASDASSAEGFGYSTALSGQTLIVGSPYDDDFGAESGSAFLFNSTTGEQLFKLTPADIAPEDYFGWNVAISGNTAIVGSVSDDDDGTDSGSAYLFDVSTGAQLFKLTASDAAANDWFGYSVAISGNKAIVGSRRDDDFGANSGSAYVFDVTTGQQLMKLTAADAIEGALFGGSVAISGNTAIIGAILDNGVGAAYLFDLTTGQQLHKLTSPEPAPTDLFGSQVAISGNRAIVGSSLDDDGGTDSGSAYLFDVTTGQQLFKLNASDAESDDQFGTSVAISGSTAVVGSRYGDHAGLNTGAAYFFDVTTGDELTKVNASDAATGTDFGIAIAIDGERAVVGAWLDDELGADAGGAYEFHQVHEWTLGGAGSWSGGSNWSTGKVPNSDDVYVRFGGSIVQSSDVFVDVDATVSKITFDNSSFSYSLSGDGSHSLTLAGVATIEVAAGVHTINAPIQGTMGLKKTGGGTLILSGPKNYSGVIRDVDTNEVYPSFTLINEGTVVVEGSPLPAGLISVGGELRLKNFVFYELEAGTRLQGFGGSHVTMEHSFSDTELFIALGAVVRGTPTIAADQVVNSGRISPGFSPGIIKIQGDYIQESDGSLEMEVGGLTPGTQHDQLQVSGSASLGGRLDVPIINGFVPAVNNQVTIITADEVSGQFASLASPNLGQVAPNLAIQLIYGSNNVRVRFVAPSTQILFDADAPTADWSDGATWNTGNAPGTTNIISVQNLLSVAQRVDVESVNAFTHQLSVTGDAQSITVGVKGGLSLSATVGVAIGNNGIVELDDGRLVSGTVTVNQGGRLAGNGVVAGKLVVGTGGMQSAVVSPGFSVGHLDVEGDYQQGSNGQLVIEIDGASPGQTDTVAISGTAQLGGRLSVDVSQLGSPTAGTTVEILTAGNLVGIFNQVETIGSDDIYIRPIYDDGAGGGGASVSGGICDLGDMNCDGQLNSEDSHAFAVALRDLDAYFEEFFTFTTAGGDLDGFADGQFHPNGRIDFDDIDDFVSLASVPDRESPSKAF